MFMLKGTPFACKYVQKQIYILHLDAAECECIFTWTFPRMFTGKRG